MPGLSSLLDLIFPLRCVVCQRVGAMVCASCLSSMQPPEAPICARCGQTMRVRASSAPSLCLDCANGRGPKYLDGVRAATTYTGAVRPAALALKFRGQRGVAECLAPLMIAPFQSDIHTADMVIPVPLHASRRRERGYNQAELLARAFAASQRLPVRTDVLVRARATEAQTHLSQAERRRNVAGAFALSDPVTAKSIAGRRIVLVDDVTTTGQYAGRRCRAVARRWGSLGLGIGLRKASRGRIRRERRALRRLRRPGGSANCVHILYSKWNRLAHLPEGRRRAWLLAGGAGNDAGGGAGRTTGALADCLAGGGAHCPAVSVSLYARAGAGGPCARSDSHRLWGSPQSRVGPLYLHPRTAL